MNKKLKLAAMAAAMLAVTYLGNSWIRAQNGAPKAAVAAEGRSRVALLNISHVIKNYQKAVALNSEMKELFTPLQAKTKAKNAQLEALAKEVQLKPDQRDNLEKQARILKRELEDISNEAQNIITKKQDDMVVLIYREIQDAAQRTAISHGYDMVLHYNDPTTSAEYWSPANIVRKMQAGACMPIYFAPGIDISADVVNSLNQAYSRLAPPTTPAGGLIPTGGTAPKK